MDAAEKIVQANRKARECVEAIGADALSVSRERFRSFVREYVQARFLLDEAEMSRTDSLNELARLSILKAAQEAGEESRQVDIPDCQNSSTAETKRILMQIRMNEDLGVKVPPGQTAKAETTEDLADIIYAFVTEGRAQAGK